MRCWRQQWNDEQMELKMTKELKGCQMVEFSMLISSVLLNWPKHFSHGNDCVSRIAIDREINNNNKNRNSNKIENKFMKIQVKMLKIEEECYKSKKNQRKILRKSKNTKENWDKIQKNSIKSKILETKIKGNQRKSGKIE